MLVPGEGVLLVLGQITRAGSGCPHGRAGIESRLPVVPGQRGPLGHGGGGELPIDLTLEPTFAHSLLATISPPGLGIAAAAAAGLTVLMITTHGGLPASRLQLRV